MFRYQHLIDEKNALLRKMTRDLRQANKTMAAQNAELDAFAHTVAHELKNPLSVIMGNTYLPGKKEYQESPTKIKRVCSI